MTCHHYNKKNLSLGDSHPKFWVTVLHFGLICDWKCLPDWYVAPRSLSSNILQIFLFGTSRTMLHRLYCVVYPISFCWINLLWCNVYNTSQRSMWLLPLAQFSFAIDGSIYPMTWAYLIICEAWISMVCKWCSVLHVVIYGTILSTSLLHSFSMLSQLIEQSPSWLTPMLSREGRKLDIIVQIWKNNSKFITFLLVMKSACNSSCYVSDLLTLCQW